MPAAISCGLLRRPNFLTGGGPSTLDYYKGAGKTDLLVTWLYKLTNDSNDYNLAATLSLVAAMA